MNKDALAKKAFPWFPHFLPHVPYTHSLRPDILWQFVGHLCLELNLGSCFSRSRGERTSLPLLLRVCEITQLSHLLLPGDVAMPDCLSLPCFRSHTIHQGRMADRMYVELWVIALPWEHLIFHLAAVAISPSSLPRQEVCLAEEVTHWVKRRSHQCLLLWFHL